MIPADQSVTILFHTKADSAEVNKRHINIRQLGIYSGGRLTVVDGPSHAASLSLLVCEISDGTHQVRVKINAAASITVPAATPYVVLRWTYTGAATDLIQVLAVADPSANPNDLVVGKRNLAGDLSGFVYGDTASPSYPRSTPNTQDLFLKVEPTEDTELNVRIRAGKYQSATASVVIPDQKSDVFVAPGANSKVYLVYVDTDGTIKIDSSGTAAASPVPPDYAGKPVLAEVTLSSTDTNITVDKIKDVRSYLSASPTPWNHDTTLLRTGVTSGVKHEIDLSAIVGSQVAFIMLRCKSAVGKAPKLVFADSAVVDFDSATAAINICFLGNATTGFATLVTDSAGKIWVRSTVTDAGCRIYLQGYILP